jgi:pimeloyl-ACP methyl ester carboxylesterase
MNEKVYGSTKPFQYQDHFDKITIPITYYISMDDRLIRADDVLKHFETLNAVRPDLARMKVFSGIGHCDFNYLQSETVRSEFAKLLKRLKMK